MSTWPIPERHAEESGLRLRAAFALGLTLAGLACGRQPSGAGVRAPPLPANLAEFDPRAAARIREAVAKVDAERGDARAWADLGTLYFSEHLKEPALECLAVAERLDPREPKWPYRAAIVQAQNGALEEAGAAMQRSIALEPNYAPSHARSGNYRFGLGDLDGAERAYREAIRLDASYPGGWVGLARVELQRDQAAEAVSILERLSREDPDSRTFRQLLASARHQLDPNTLVPSDSVLADEEAQVWNDPWEHETRAFTRVPTMLEVSELLDHGRAAEALPMLEEERAHGGDPTEIGLLLATAHERLGHLDDARRELATLLAREPDNLRALLLQARLLDDAGDLAGVVRTLERVTTLQPANGGAFAAKAGKLAQMGQHEPAVVAWRRALELGVRDYELRASLGNSLVTLRRWPEAIELFQAMLVERPDDGDVWLQLALARLRSGALDEASDALARARATGNASPKLDKNVEKALEETRARRAQSGAPPAKDGGR